jgi:tetratricopeptide (TPR) repeat protein
VSAIVGLGYAYRDKGLIDQAIAAFRRATILPGNQALAYCELGLLLEKTGEFAEAVASLRRGHELGSHDPDWRQPSGQWLAHAQRLLDLDRRLPAVLEGKDRPASPSERLDFAQLCRRYKHLYAAAAHFFEQALAEEPGLGQDGAKAVRYGAACAAARAAARQGLDAAHLDDREREHWRGRALSWLRDDLRFWSGQLDQDSPAARRGLREALHYWQRSPDLASVRDADALARLPASEREAWRKLWDDVNALLTRAQ